MLLVKQVWCPSSVTWSSTYQLTTGKNEKYILECPCHKIYRMRAVGQKTSNYSLKITIFVSMWNFGQFLEIFTILIFINKVQIKKIFSTYMWSIWLWLTTTHHVLFLLSTTQKTSACAELPCSRFDKNSEIWSYHTYS